MDQMSPRRPSLIVLIRWPVIVAVILAFFVPSLYAGQMQIERLVQKHTAPIRVSAHINDPGRQIGVMWPQIDPTSRRMLRGSMLVEIPPSMRENNHIGTRNLKSSSTHQSRSEHMLHRIIFQAAERYNVDSALIKAIIMVESRFNSRAVSKKGARGLMQLMPRTAKLLGVTDSFNPEQNINGGVRHFRGLLNIFNGDVRLALAAYHAGSVKVKKYKGVPPYKATRHYINQVFQYYQFYR